MLLRRSLPVLITFLILYLLIPVLAYSQEIGKITKVQGRVDIMRARQAAAEAVKLEDAVSIGDIVRTKSDGNAEITFIDNSVMRVGPKSRLGIDEYLFKPEEGKRTASLKLYRGMAGFDILKADFPGEGSKFEMKTRTAIAGVRGTKGILYTDGAERVYIKEGKVKFSNPLGSVMVTAGRVGEIVYGRAPVERSYSETEYKRYEDKLTPKRIEKESKGEQKEGKETLREETGAKSGNTEKLQGHDEAVQQGEGFKGMEDNASSVKGTFDEKGDYGTSTTPLPVITDVVKPKTPVDVKVTFP